MSTKLVLRCVKLILPLNNSIPEMPCPQQFIIFTTATTAAYLPSNRLNGRTKKCYKGE